MTNFKEPEKWYSPEEFDAYLEAEKKQEQRDSWRADHNIITGEKREPRRMQESTKPPLGNSKPDGPAPGEKGYKRKIL